MAKCIKIGTSYGLIIPRPLLERLRVVPGDELELKIDGDKLTVKGKFAHNAGIRSKAGKPKY